MSRLARRLGLAASLLLFAAEATRPPAARGSQREHLQLTIVFTGDVAGYLEPCG